MKKILLFHLILLTISSFAQKITRGPDIGEIYFLGPTTNGEGLYYSIDFGETATFVDGSMNYISIAADKTQGGVYCVEMPENLYYSGNYGYSNSWDFRNGEVTDNINSGVIEGNIFSGCVLHSEDYGVNFTYHSLNGFFGNPKNVTIDNVDDNIGYVLTYKLTQSDSLYLLRTTDTFENVEVIQQWNYHWSNNIILSYGSVTGEVLLINFTLNNILYSNNYGDDFIRIDTFNITNYFQVGMVGGQQEGELYVLYNFVNLLWQNAHIYIFHSVDYGKTFGVFHPFAKGNEPVLANFSITEKEVHLTAPAEFSNFSIGDIQEYQWDFDNDGIIDSYEESPVYIYQDTGWYSVRLSVVGPDSTNSFIKEDYIHVIDTITSVNKIEKQPDKIRIFPNPFSSVLTIQINNKNKTKGKVEILDNRGEIVYKTESTGQSIIWDGCNITGKKCRPGIYYIKTNNSVHKVILIN